MVVGLKRAAARQRAKGPKVRRQLRPQGCLGTHHSHVAAFCPNFCPKDCACEVAHLHHGGLWARLASGHYGGVPFQ